MKTSQKIEVGILTASTVFSMFAPLSVTAKTTVKNATSSGDTSRNEKNTIKDGICTGDSKLSGLDAEVFKKVTQKHDGKIVCVKSNGFRTDVKGTNDIKNYHWTAWYKNNYNDDVDRKLEKGNYYGFSADKVKDWKSYEDNIRALNGGRFPQVKSYTYPTDTKSGKLDFWGDIAGYYGVLGDPQYSKLHLDAYQKFSYRVENVYEKSEYITDPNYVPSYEEPGHGGRPSNDGNSSHKGNSGNKGQSSHSSGGHKKPQTKPNGKDKWEETPPKPNKYPYKVCHQFLCEVFDKPGHSHVIPNGNNMGIPGLRSVSKSKNSNKKIASSGWKGSPVFNTEKNRKEIYLGNGKYKIISYITDIYNETAEVKVASADIAANAYATEIAEYGRIALKPGSKGTLSYNVGHNKFWKVTPSYWTDGGKEVIKNVSSYPYHFASEGSEGSGKNNLNLYASITKRDKMYSLVHGYPDITKLPPEKYDPSNPKPHGVPDPDGYPKKDNNGGNGSGNTSCIKVSGKKYCPKPETPIIHIPIDIDDNKPQQQVEVDRFVHLTK